MKAKNCRFKWLTDIGNMSAVYHEQEAVNDFHDGLIAPNYWEPRSRTIKI